MFTVMFVRHADIDIPVPNGNPDPPLNAKGLERANELARVAGKAGVTTLLTSSLLRTKQTAAPLASSLARNPSVAPDLDLFDANVRVGIYGPVILVVGHSNTVPPMVDKLIGRASGVTIGGFDDLILVTVTSDESQFVGLKYGAS